MNVQVPVETKIAAEIEIKFACCVCVTIRAPITRGLSHASAFATAILSICTPTVYATVTVMATSPVVCVALGTKCLHKLMGNSD